MNFRIEAVNTKIVDWLEIWYLGGTKYYQLNSYASDAGGVGCLTSQADE